MTSAVKNVKIFVEAWINAWNSHDLEKILSHYAEDIEIITPMIAMATDNKQGSLKGKTNVAQYWSQALKKFPDLHFELYEITQGIDCIAVYYQSILNKNAIEVMYLNNDNPILNLK